MYKFYTKTLWVPPCFIVKLLLIMRLTTLILITAILQVSASSYAQKITLSEKNAPLVKVFDQIRAQSGFDFLVSAAMLKEANPVTIQANHMKLEEVLEKIFESQPLKYSIEDKSVVVSKKEKTFLDHIIDAFTAENISGRVVDEKGNPLEGATFSVFSMKGKVTKTTYRTDDKGRFSFAAELGDEVTVSYLGYQNYTFVVEKNMPFQDIVLKGSTSQLNEVVVQTGYQTLSKERATGSFAKPDMKVFANRSSSLDLVARLEGQIPGLYISHSNNAAFNKNGSGVSTNESIIRGTSSVELSADPLYVVDGVVATDFSSVNLDNVADITVLKDAAAAAIWGARAANGVIVVTTKTGKNNQKIQVGYTGYVNFSGKPNLDYIPYLNSNQYIQAAREIFDPVTYSYASLSKAFIAPHEQILYNQYNGLIADAQANKSLDSLASINNLQQIKDNFYRSSFNTNHTVSASGGSAFYNFYSSLGYTNTQSSTPGQHNNTYRFSLNQEFSPVQRVRISLNASLVNAVSNGNGMLSASNQFLPYQLFKDGNGNNISMPYMSGLSDATRLSYESLSGISLNYNPLDEAGSKYSKQENLAVNLTSNVNVKLWKGLSFLGTYGYVTSPGLSSKYEDISEYSLRRNLVNYTKAPTTPGGNPTYLLPTNGGTYTTNNFNQRNWTVRNQLVYTYSGRNGNDLINLQGGQEVNEQHSYSTINTLLGYDEALQTYAVLDYATLKSGVSGTVGGRGSLPVQFMPFDSRSRVISNFALASYTLNHKYSIDGSWREDQSNLFGSDISSQNRPVWSGGLKWNLAEENFMKRISWLNSLDLRGTYGITGNSPAAGGVSTYNVLISEQLFGVPLVGGNSYRIGDYGNTKLNWETTHTINLGLDFSVLKERLSGTVDYYHKNTTSLLGAVPLNPFGGSSGSTGTGNIGNLTNTGIELSLSSINLRSDNFSWSSRFVFSYNNNKLVSYSAQSTDDLDASEVISGDFAYAGYSLSPLFAYRFEGLDNVGDPLIRFADGTVSKNPKGTTINDLVYEGSTIPTMTGGFSNSFRYKQFELAINTVYSLGAKMFRPGINTFYTGRLTGSATNLQSGNLPEEFANRWKQPGDEAFTNIPAYTSNSKNNKLRNVNYYEQGDVNVISADYLKLADATFSYNLNPKLLRWAKIQSADVHIQVSNILLWSNNKYGIDPTAGQIPTDQHNITIGANLNF